MAPLPVVPYLDVIKDSRSRLGACVPIGACNQVPFQGSKKAFRHSVIIAVSLPTHARRYCVCGEHDLIVQCGILRHHDRSEAADLEQDIGALLPSATLPALMIDRASAAWPTRPRIVRQDRG
jgi:hypothetical protein